MPSIAEPLTTNDLLALAVQTFDELLPEGWETILAAAGEDPYADRRAAPDALLAVAAPDGSMARFAVAARMAPAGRDTAPVLAMLESWCDANDAVPLLAARYLSPTVRERLAEASCSFVDAVGNVAVSHPVPAIALVGAGASRDPWRRPHVRDTLRGEPAARVARALCDNDAPISIARLIELAGASAGASYRVLDLLFAEGLAEKGERGWVESVDWQRLLRRWAEDWAAAERRFSLRYEIDAGRADLLKRLAKEPDGSYVLGGGAAAAALTGRETESIVIHSDQAAALAERLSARPAARKAVAPLLIHARGLGAAAAGSAIKGKLRIAAPSQAYADMLLAGDGDAGRLLKAMRKSETAWRSRVVPDNR